MTADLRQRILDADAAGIAPAFEDILELMAADDAVHIAFYWFSLYLVDLARFQAQFARRQMAQAA